MANKNFIEQHCTEQECLQLVISNLKESDCYGLTLKDYKYLSSILNVLNTESLDIKQNELTTKTEFPDFSCHSGFLEHFAVTSSLENRKGASQKRASMNFKNSSKENFSTLVNHSSPHEIIMYSTNRKLEKHTHDYLLKSIKKNWLNHIASYDKSNYDHTFTRIFMMEYIDCSIETAINIKDVHIPPYKSYKISVDKIILEWLYSYADQVDYVIFVCRMTCSIDIIKMDAIPDLIKMIDKFLGVWHESSIGIETHNFALF